MPIAEKSERNQKVYFEKIGYANEKEALLNKPSRKPLTYRQLIAQYIKSLSPSAIFDIVTRQRKKWEAKRKQYKKEQEENVNRLEPENPRS